MKKFKVTQDADYMVGYLRCGHREGIIEAESIEDADFDDMPFEIEEVID